MSDLSNEAPVYDIGVSDEGQPIVKSGPGTCEYRIRCTNCGLHYSVYSWEHWADTRAIKGGGYCPECGIAGAKIVWGPVDRNQFIFQLVPGDAEMHGMVPPLAASPFGVPARKEGDD